MLERHEANLAGELEDVAWVRHAVADWLRGWSLAPLVEDVGLVASELTTNAILHAGGAVDVVLERRGAGVRVVVHDRRPDVVPTPPVPPPDHAAVEGDGALDRLAASLFERTTTGRGLLLVQAFSEAWGVDVDGASKGVWAEVGTGRSDQAGASHPPPPGGAQAPEPNQVGFTVRLPALPVRLVLLSAANLDELVRELQTTDFPTSAPTTLAALGERLARETSAHREPLRVAARGALQRREATVEVTLVVPPGQVESLRQFVALTDEVETFCREGVLLSGAPTPEVTAFRRWYVEEVARQAGGGLPEACPFPA